MSVDTNNILDYLNYPNFHCHDFPGLYPRRKCRPIVELESFYPDPKTKNLTEKDKQKYSWNENFGNVE